MWVTRPDTLVFWGMASLLGCASTLLGGTARGLTRDG